VTTRGSRRLPPEQRRRQLIDAAIELYSQRPFEQVSVEDIAEAADVSRALFYRYFTSPGELFAAASRVAIDGLVARLTTPAEGPLDQRLRHGVAEFVDFVEHHPAAFVAVVRNSSAISTETGGLVKEVRLAIVDVIKAGAGLTGELPLIDLTIWCWAAAMEEATLRWLREPVLGKDALIDWMTGQLLAMMMASGQFSAG
jgi:AcrR family transcriptional regulator